jgi:hypothetical protein
MAELIKQLPDPAAAAELRNDSAWRLIDSYNQLESRRDSCRTPREAAMLNRTQRRIRAQLKRLLGIKLSNS